MEMSQVWQVCGGGLPFFPGQLSGPWASGHSFGIPLKLEFFAALEDFILGLTIDLVLQKETRGHSTVPWAFNFLFLSYGCLTEATKINFLVMHYRNAFSFRDCRPDFQLFPTSLTQLILLIYASLRKKSGNSDFNFLS